MQQVMFRIVHGAPYVLKVKVLTHVMHILIVKSIKSIAQLAWIMHS